MTKGKQDLEAKCQFPAHHAQQVAGSERNRIKRRMREAVRKSLGHLQSDVDVVLHPRKSILQMELPRLEGEVSRIFVTVEASLKKAKETSA